MKASNASPMSPLPGRSASHHHLSVPREAAALTRPRVVALVVGRADRSAIEGALATTADVVFVPRVDELSRCWKRDGTIVDLIIAEPRDRDDTLVAPVLEEIKGCRRDIAMVGYCPPGRSLPTDIVQLVHSGVDGIVWGGAMETGPALRSAVAQARREAIVAAIRKRISALHPRPLHTVIAFSVHNPVDASSITAVAAAVGKSRRTLINLCTRHRALPPRRLVTWCRLLTAGTLLRHAPGSVERVALQLGFASSVSFRGLLRRYAGLRPEEVRAEQGLERMFARFEEAVSAQATTTGARPVMAIRPGAIDERCGVE